MAKIVLLSCTKSKMDHRVPTQELYSASPMFRKTLEYGKALNPDKMYILSAKHFLVPLDKKLEPYDKTLKEMPKDEKEEWGKVTIQQMKDEGLNLDKDKFIFLTGSEYLKPFIGHIKHIENPMEGLRLGQRLGWLNKQLNKLTEIFKRVKQAIYECIIK